MLDEIRRRGRIICSYEELTYLVKSNSNCAVFYINPYVMGKLELERYALDDRIYFVIEGNSAVYLSKIMFGTKFESLNFDDSGIADKVLGKVNLENTSIRFIGGTQNDIEHYRQKIIQKYKNFKGAQFLNGYDWDEQRIKKLRDLVDLTIISMGVGKQELLSLQLLDTQKTQNVIVAGGYISQFAASEGSIYPSIIVKLKLRFLYRAFKNREILKRLLFIYPRVYVIWLVYLFRRKSF